ncbi:hypothetical protein DPMN_087289 [Dreissena polymorpha]|uniref:Uncharacterized protein n=1 Tax=Dreissena polymorpha TaxID=45954 RepID=A0A9D4KSI5_DREPO|nr:hypothetical protein DPMN_087289 [Dreissena polymorpha]
MSNSHDVVFFLHSIRQDNVSHGTYQGKGREGSLETSSTVTWMQMLSDGQNMGAAGETRTETRRLEEAG